MFASLQKFLVELDIFGHPIQLNYKGKTTYQTKFGAFFTLATFVIIMINFVSISTDFVNNENQKEVTRFLKLNHDESDTVNMVENKFSFALFTGKAKPKMGCYVVYLTNK